MVTINFDDTYPMDQVAEDLSFMTFTSKDHDDKNVLIRVEISPLDYPLLPEVQNLAFGPLQADGKIDDSAKVYHSNINKVFSTILLFAFTYLDTHPQELIGIDGSNDVRAYLYHRMFQTNQVYLSDYFTALGVDWYVRILKNGNFEAEEDGNILAEPKIEPFNYKRSRQDLYRYYLFRLSR